MKITSEQLSCKRLQIAHALWARVIWLAYEKFKRDNLSEIALEIMYILILIPYMQTFQHAHRPRTFQLIANSAESCNWVQKVKFYRLASKSRKHNKQNGCVIHWITSSFTKTPPGLEFTLFISSITQRYKHTKYNRRNLSQKLDSTFTKAAKRAKSRKSMLYRVCSQINFKKCPAI